VSAEETKALFRRAYEELWNRGNLSVADELIAPDFVNHSASAGSNRGPESMSASVTWARKAFPDLRFEIDIQTKAVETFLKSRDKLLQYDALTDDDVQEMKANETALQDMAAQAGNLAPPRKYEEQQKVFDAAIDELREAARLVHGMAADPVASAELGFNEYDGHVNEASALLQQSNELLGEDYEAIEGVKEISPEF
jgi:hypothetical protein